MTLLDTIAAVAVIGGGFIAILVAFGAKARRRR